MTTRRQFFQKTSMGMAFAAVSSLSGTAEANSCYQVAGDTFKLGCAGYTFRHFNLEETLTMLKRLDVHYLCIKDFHLPLNSTPEEIAAFHKKCSEYNVVGYGVGPIYMGSPEEVNTAFEYARRCGVKVLVGVPYYREDKKRIASAELLKLINEKVQEYDIKYAIHNHGPDMPELFPNAESMITMVQDMDKRVGICLDIGHELRDGGRCPAKAIVQYADRLHDMHIKNVTAPDKSGRGIEMPRGKINMTAVLKAIRQVGYTGVCSLEYEKDMKDPFLGIAESIGYFRGVMDATRK